MPTASRTVKNRESGPGKPFKAEPQTEKSSRMKETALKILGERFTTNEGIAICERNLDSLAGLLAKRGYNFFKAYVRIADEVSGQSPALLLGFFSEGTLQEISGFSLRGLERWIASMPVQQNWMGRITDTGEAYRYVTLTGEYGDVGLFKAGGAAVELGDVSESLRMFSIACFGKYLLIGECKTGAVTREKSDYIFLPETMADFDQREENKNAYYIISGHEAAHKAYGSFKARIEELAEDFKRHGIDIKVEEDAEGDRMLVTREGKTETLTRDDFARILDMLPHSRFLLAMFNVVEDMRIDSWRIEEKTPGHKGPFQNFVRVFLPKRVEEAESKGEMEAGFIAFLAITSLLSAATDKRAAMEALYPTIWDRVKRRGYQGNENEKEILGICKGLSRKQRRLVKRFREDLLELAANREDHATESWKLAFRICDRIRKDLKGNEKGNLDQAFRYAPMPGGMSREIAADMVDLVKEKKGDGEESGIVEGGAELGAEIKEPEQVIVERLEEADIQLDDVLVQNVKRLLMKIRSQKPAYITGALYGREDTRARNLWLAERRRGIIKPRDYYLEETKTDMRSVAMLSIGDASGSTGAHAGRETVNRVIVRINNSLAHAVHGLAGLRFAFGYYNRLHDGTHYYEGMGFSDKLRKAATWPDGYNLDHEVIRFGGDILRRQKAKIRILVLNLDSMTGGGSSYMEGIDAVRNELAILRRDGILTYTITLPPSDSYFRSAGFETVKDYLDYIYGPGNYMLIKEIRQLEDAWLNFIKAKARLFRG